MGLFKQKPDLQLSSRLDTVTVSPNNPDFSSLIPYVHTIPSKQALQDLGSSEADGLSSNEADRRLETCGENLLDGDDGISAIKVLLGQLGKIQFPSSLV